MQVKAATKVQSVARRRLAKRRVTALREKKMEEERQVSVRIRLGLFIFLLLYNSDWF